MGVLAVALRELRDRVRALEVAVGPAVEGALVETGASAPSSTSERAGARLLDQRERRVRDHPARREPESEPVPAVEPALFADLVLRESVVKAASLALRRTARLSPANRNRIWFEMRREVKRARKERKAEEREAIREWRARQRAAVQEESAA